MEEKIVWVAAVLDENGRAVRVRALTEGPPPRHAALGQAVIYANAQAHSVRKSPEEVVAAATVFEAFLTRPEEDNPE